VSTVVAAAVAVAVAAAFGVFAVFAVFAVVVSVVGGDVVAWLRLSISSVQRFIFSMDVRWYGDPPAVAAQQLVWTPPGTSL